MESSPPPSHHTDVEPRVGIFWDYENCSAPASVPGYIVAEHIRNAAHKFGTVTIFKAYLELSTVNISPKMINLRSELQSSGVSLTDCPRASNRKDVVDKMLLVDMLAFAMDNPAPAVIMLISGDRDYVYAVSVLRLRKYDVVLVIPPIGAHITLRSQATVVLDWKYDIFSETNIDWNARGEYSSTPGAPALGGPNGVGSSNGRNPLFFGSVEGTRRRSPATPPRTLYNLKEPVGSPSLDAQVATRPPLELPQTPPKGHLDLDLAIDVNDAPPSPGPSSFSPRKTRPTSMTKPPDSNPHQRMFSNLIETLEEWRLMGNKKPLRSQLGAALVKKNPLLYQRAGVKNFGEYIALAEKANVVVLGEASTPGREWIALADAYMGNVFPVFA